MKCPYCLHEWEYNGTAKYYATCPRCFRKVRLHPYVYKGYAEKAPLFRWHPNYQHKPKEKEDKFTKLLNNPEELMKLYDNQPTLVLYAADLFEEDEEKKEEVK